MSGQISHVIHGQKIFERIQNKSLDWEKFVVATVFPDIRQLAGLDRNVLHKHNTTEDKIPLDDSFLSGLYVHSFVDEKRIEILEGLGAYDENEMSHAFDTALKLRSEKLFYEYLDDWNQIIEYLDQIYPEEKQYVQEIEIVEIWHRFLKEYFVRKPDWEIWNKLLIRGGYEDQKISEIKGYLENIESDKKFDDMLYTLREEI